MAGSIDAQLYAVRLVSELLCMVTILVGWGVTELTPGVHPLRLLFR